MRHIKNITILALFSIILCLTISSCGDSKSGPSNKKSNTAQQVNEVNNEVIENQTTETKAETKTDKHSKSNSNIFVYISLFLNVIVLVYVYLRSSSIHSRLDRHREYIRDLKSNSRHQGNRGSSSNGLTSREVSQLISKHLSEERNLAPIVDYIRQLERLDAREKVSEVVRPSAQQFQSTPKVTEIKMYVGSPEGDTFHKTYDNLNDNITYEMITNGGNIAEFKVHPSALKKVLTEPTFLETACEMHITRRGELVSLVMLENGKAEKQPSGKWKITKKAKVKFE